MQCRTNNHVCHDDDQRVFLDVKWSRIEIDRQREWKVDDFEGKKVGEEFAEWVDEESVDDE